MKVNFVVLLTLLFIGLKLTGHITWSWLWVLSPMWITFVFALCVPIIVAGAVGVFVFVVGYLTTRQESYKRYELQRHRRFKSKGTRS